MNGRKRKILISLLAVFVSISVLTGACVLYLCDYYRVDEDAVAAFMPRNAEWTENADGNIVFEPDGATKGFIFYPGGKVEYTSYIPLMQALSEKGILCVLVEMPFNLAVFDINAADGIREQYPEIADWYIGGHSLGGSMAASYLADNTDDFEGLILLGAYSTVDLSLADIDVLSVFGSEDTVMNREKYDANKVNLPSDYTEVVIDGGCHAFFGMYGAQDGDGTPSITNAEQINTLADCVGAFVK